LGGAGLNGGYGRSNDDETAIACVRRAVDRGVNYIDTSAGYGESERRIGLALAGGYRERVILATKTGTGTRPADYSGEGTRRSVEKSLHLLRTDYIDLLQIHDPEEMEPVLTPGGALDVLSDLKEKGVIGAIGIGVRSHDFLLRAIRHGAFDTILTYADFNLVRQTARESLLPEAARSDIGVVLGSPLLFGLLSDRPWDSLLRERGSSGESEEEGRIARIRRWAEREGVSLLRLALQFCLREPRIGVVLTGSATPEEADQNIDAALSPLPEETWTRLSEDLGIA
jgi:aryl-alcohol dehydrogenase-like predicted oxidoreductase